MTSHQSHKKSIRGLAALGALLLATAAHADIKVGIDLSSTGRRP